MAAITVDNVNAILSKIIPVGGMEIDLPVAASTVIYKDTFVGFNAAGYLVSYIPWAQASTPTGTPFVGIAVEHIDSQTAAGDARCRVLVSGYFEYALTAAAQLDVGKSVHAIDNATLSKIGLNNGFVGTIIDIPSSARVLVDMGTPAMRRGVANGIMFKRVNVDFANAVDDEVYLVHETENHNGLILRSAHAVATEQFECTDAAGVVTLVHTLGTDTTLGCTLTSVDSLPIADAILGSGGLADVAATNAALIPVPADVAVIAKVTTVCDDASEAGKADIFASFLVK